MITTPSYSCLNANDFEHIYEPAEDSFLLIDAIEKDLQALKFLQPVYCLEIGSGSGIITSALGSAIGPSCEYHTTDINPLACEATKKVGIENSVAITSHCCDLVSNIPDYLYGKVDILLFNPPYVATPEAEVGKGDLEHTWAGGNDGRQVMDRLFPTVPELLSLKGVFYLLVERVNKPELILLLMEELGFNGEVVVERRTGREMLFVLKFVHS